MTNIIELNPSYSTTRHVLKSDLQQMTEEVKLSNKPEDKFETVLFLPEGEGRQGEGGLRTKGCFKQSQDDNPLITVVTVVFNGEKFLEETILSVLNQTYDNVEYLIIDGGSTDGTLDIIRKHESSIDYWVSEKDQGIYDAMNKGISVSTGVIIGLVNADDIYYPQALKTVSRICKNNSLTGFAYGSIDLIDELGEIYGKSTPLPHALSIKRRFKEMPYPHLSMFVSRHIYKQIGLFDTQFRLSSDYDFTLKMIQQGFWGNILPSTVGAFRAGGRSGGIETFLETRKVHRKHGVNSVRVELNFLNSVMKIILVRFMPSPIVFFLRKLRLSKNSYI